MLTETDKSGKFAVLPINEFRKKSDIAIEGLFTQFNGNLRQIKREVAAILKDSDFPALVSRMNGISRDTFGIEFFLKDHKVGLPLRVVVNENGTWQKLVSSFLRRALAVLEVGSPLYLCCSHDLITDLHPFYGKQCTLLSMNINGLYYSLEPKTLLVRVSQFLEKTILLGFRYSQELR
ncbi:unnamed protein product [Ixodes hexagonus]